jgi:hypothetical protein
MLLTTLVNAVVLDVVTDFVDADAVVEGIAHTNAYIAVVVVIGVDIFAYFAIIVKLSSILVLS